VHFIITDAWLARSRAIHLSGRQLAVTLGTLTLVLVLGTAAVSQWLFVTAARENWPIAAAADELIGHGDVGQRDRFVRENLDAMARRLGEMRAKLAQLESLGERVSGLAGVSLADLAAAPGQGGVLVSGRPLNFDELRGAMSELDRLTGQHTDLLTVLESRLLDKKMSSMMLPTRAPVPAARLGSPFGWRIDPFTGRSALHTGLDYDALAGTPVLAAAGGIVLARETQAAYGNVVEIDHGNDVVTRYAHLSRFSVRSGDLVQRGQQIGEVGTSGRSTGPHLHFEVLVRGVPQNPQQFVAGGRNWVQLAHSDAVLTGTSRPGPLSPTPR
jgi:murein DD-endopeptidase MepM/ murein hydrolase activator NlpD